MGRRGGSGNGAGSVEVYTPWTVRLSGDTLIGHSKQPWVYRSLDAYSLEDDDPELALKVGGSITGALSEVGAYSTAGPGSRRKTSKGGYRDIHVVVVDVPMTVQIPPGTPPLLEDAMRPWLSQVPSSRRVMMVGVALETLGVTTGSGGDLKAAVKSMAKNLSNGTIGLPDVAKDRSRVVAALNRAGARTPSRVEWDHATAWWNRAMWADCPIIPHFDHVHVFRDAAGFQTLRFLVDDGSASYGSCRDWPADLIGHLCMSMGTVHSFGEEGSDGEFDPYSGVELSVLDQRVRWIPTMFEYGALAVSIRGLLEPGRVTRRELRAQRKKVLDDLATQERTGKLDRSEYEDQLEFVEHAEQRYAAGRVPSVMDVSATVAMPVPYPWWEGLDWRDLSTRVGVAVKPLDNRQMDALDECQPCSTKRTAPVRHDLDVERVGFAGAASCAQVGEDTGVFLGKTVNDDQAVWIDPDASVDIDEVPILAVSGASGSGKTALLQSLVTQVVLRGRPAIMWNPKQDDTLAPFADNLASLGVPARVVTLDSLLSSDGVFDPYRYAEPNVAPGLALSFIMSVNPWGTVDKIPVEAEVRLLSGLRAGAVNGVRCIGDALAFVEDLDPVSRPIVGPILKLAQTDPMFRLGCGLDPSGQALRAEDGLTLIERGGANLDLPDDTLPSDMWNLPQRISIAIIRLGLTGSTYALAKRRGTVVLDEAWIFLSAGKSTLEALGRIWRSLKVWAILATQRTSDFQYLAGYTSRVLLGFHRDADEAAAGLRLIGLEPTAARIAEMDRFKAVVDRQTREVQRGALWWFRDVNRKHALVEVMVNPAWLQMFSTNAVDRERREARELNAGRGVVAAPLAALPAASVLVDDPFVGLGGSADRRDTVPVERGRGAGSGFVPAADPDPFS